MGEYPKWWVHLKVFHLSNMAMFGIYVQFKGGYSPHPWEYIALFSCFFGEGERKTLLFWGENVHGDFFIGGLFWAKFGMMKLLPSELNEDTSLRRNCVFRRKNKNDIFGTPEDLLNLLLWNNWVTEKRFKKWFLGIWTSRSLVIWTSRSLVIWAMKKGPHIVECITRGYPVV